MTEAAELAREVVSSVATPSSGRCRVMAVTSNNWWNARTYIEVWVPGGPSAEVAVASDGNVLSLRLQVQAAIDAVMAADQQRG